MAKLKVNQESFIKLMTKSDEHARRGFELLVRRPDAETYFEPLEDAGLFAPTHNPAPVPADEPGYFRIPYWAALDYLETMAKAAGNRSDLKLASSVMKVVRRTSSYREPDGSPRDNYHTYRKFAEIY